MASLAQAVQQRFVKGPVDKKQTLENIKKNALAMNLPGFSDLGGNANGIGNAADTQRDPARGAAGDEEDLTVEESETATGHMSGAKANRRG